MAGLLLTVPDLVDFDLPDLARSAGYTGTRVVPATGWLLSLLALKLTATRRVSHVDDLLLADPAAALFAGLATLPKKTALTDYSYGTSHDNQRAFLLGLDTKLVSAGLATAEQAIFDLDFHAVMHWGQDPVLEKHYVPTRSQRARSVLTFFAQDSGTHNLVYANADVSKASQNREVIAFCDHWRTVTGADPHMLVMDQKVTTHAVLGELDTRGVKFLTLRMRSTSLINHIDTLTPADFKTITLDRAGSTTNPASTNPSTSTQGLPRNRPPTRHHRPRPQRPDRHHHQRPRHHRETTHRALRPPDDHRTTPRRDHPRLPRRRPVLHRQPQRRPRHHPIVLAQAVTSALGKRLPGYAAVTPDTLQRRFIETPGRSSPPTAPSPCASNDAPTPPSCATPTSPSHHRALARQPNPPIRIRLTLRQPPVRKSA